MHLHENCGNRLASAEGHVLKLVGVRWIRCRMYSRFQKSNSASELQAGCVDFRAVAVVGCPTVVAYRSERNKPLHCNYFRERCTFIDGSHAVSDSFLRVTPHE